MTDPWQDALQIHVSSGVEYNSAWFRLRLLPAPLRDRVIDLMPIPDDRTLVQMLNDHLNPLFLETGVKA